MTAGNKKSLSPSQEKRHLYWFPADFAVKAGPQ
jgi:hypothetical protein